MLKLENTAALLSLLTASAGCVAIAFLSGYFSAIDSSLITLVSYKDLFVTLAHAFLWNAVLMLFGFIAPNLPDSSKAPNVIHPDTFSQSVEMLLARPINGNWVERLMLRMLGRVWRSRIRNKYLLISMVVMFGGCTFSFQNIF